MESTHRRLGHTNTWNNNSKTLTYHELPGDLVFLFCLIKSINLISTIIKNSLCCDPYRKLTCF